MSGSENLGDSGMKLFKNSKNYSRKLPKTIRVDPKYQYPNKSDPPYCRVPAWGFREPGECVAKQPGSREQGKRKPREQGAEELI